jgi:DNA-binding transcriptional regulator YiaG
MKAVECQKILGVDKSTLTRWENGEHKPDHVGRVKIIRFLGYDPF